MPVFLFWGDDDFRLAEAVKDLCDRSLAPQWSSFNYDKFSDQENSAIQALNQAMTPPFGLGKRVIWLQNASVFQRCGEPLLQELTRTLTAVPDTSILLFTSPHKPDGRLKSTKLLQKHGKVQEFSSIAPWKTEQLQQQVRQVAKQANLTLTPAAVELLSESVGNNMRQLVNEVEKLKLYQGDSSQPLSADAVANLVVVNTQNSLQLASALRQGDTALALRLIADLIERNEPALRIVSTLVGQFRTWLWVKMMVQAGERDEWAIAQAAEVNNPKRIYYLQKEVHRLSLMSLQQAMQTLLELDASLKQGKAEMPTLQTKIIEISQLFR
ncbi:MAG: DNA polymerase III subunit delta [Leptolyngbyaceae cyanobacterium SM1_1_3]|nr:DNA polymerase III subunit delta [Leptolyngbyaceae cyanobacterium SM1_1_3]NJN01621.1 DNA polymerase III subunit delta [Leptolyngbyaceae cyanobacterium RM1_1_2]NJO09866.1 DNA polymerase III subunit delta [Leptolyngbyaceae cyanobacterium SL_1_1]